MKNIHVVLPKHLQLMLEIQIIMAAGYLAACNTPQLQKTDYEINSIPKWNIPQSNQFAMALQFLKGDYVDSFSYIPDRDTSIAVLIARLDPYSYYLSKVEKEQFDADLSENGSIMKFGFHDWIRNDTPFVYEVNPFSVCRKNGLCIGDKILAFDEVSLVHRSLEFVDSLFEANKDWEYTLTILRPGEDITRSVEIIRSAIPGKASFCSFMLDSVTAYIWSKNFDRGIAAKLEASIKQLRIDNTGFSNLIIDLRWNDGGFVDEAVAMLSLFNATSDPVIEVRSDIHPQNNWIYHTTRSAVFSDLKLIVLTNEHSYSAAEIFSGVLQDWDKALILGQQTGGKGLVMQFHALEDGSSIYYSTSRYFLPSKRCVQIPYQERVQMNKIPESDALVYNLMHRKEKQFRCNDRIYYTKNGRSVYDQMGIIPDVLMPDYSNGYAIADLSSADRFGLEFELVGQYQKLLIQNPTFESFERNFPVKEAVKYIGSRLTEISAVHFDPARTLALVRRIMFWMQWDYYGLGTQTAATLMDDNLVREARRIFLVETQNAKKEVLANATKEQHGKKRIARTPKKLAVK